jgi:hypothetical protein
VSGNGVEVHTVSSSNFGWDAWNRDHKPLPTFRVIGCDVFLAAAFIHLSLKNENSIFGAGEFTSKLSG